MGYSGDTYGVEIDSLLADGRGSHTGRQACHFSALHPFAVRCNGPDDNTPSSQLASSRFQKHVLLENAQSNGKTTACVLSHDLFPCILSSSQDKMHCTLSLTVCTCTPCQRASFNSTTDSFSWGRDPYTLACKARPSFDRCGTSLSVSLSLSLSTAKHSFRHGAGQVFTLQTCC